MASRSRVRPTSFLSSSSESEPDDVSELDCRSGSSPLPQSHSTPRSVSSRQSQRSASVSDRTATPSHDSIERDSPNGLSLSPRSFSIADFDDTSTASNSFVSNPSQQTIMTLIRETNTLVKGFNNKLIELERKVQEITAKEPHSSTVVATRAKERKTVVTDEIRRETRRIYKKLLSSEQSEANGEDFIGWNLEPSQNIKSSQNQKVLEMIVTEVKKVHSDFDSASITEAAKRYYRSCREENSRQRRGVANSRKDNRRKEERITRKRKERAIALERCNIPETSKAKWRKVMDNILMSSEESDEESTSDSERRVRILRKHKLTYRSDKVTAFFAKLDDLVKEDKKSSALASRLFIPRRDGALSSRVLPENHMLPSWAISNT